MERIKAALILLSSALGCGFLDGALGLGLTDEFYTIVGFVAIGAIAWMWIIVATHKD